MIAQWLFSVVRPRTSCAESVEGGTRFIGPPTVSVLLCLGHDLTIFHRGETGSAPDGVAEILGDRHDLPAQADRLRYTKPDIVLDMIPIVEKDGQDLMDVFDGHVARVVVISSMDVYRAYGRLIGKEPGPSDPVPLTEESPLRETLYPYRGGDHGRPILEDYDKIPIERIVMSRTNLPGTVLRLPMVYGPGDYQHRLFAHVKRIQDGRPILLGERASRWRTSRGYVENVADAIALAVTDSRSAGEIYNVAEPEALSEAEWVRSIGAEPVIVPDANLPEHLIEDAWLQQELVASTVKIRKHLGYSERAGSDDAIRKTVEWESESARNQSRRVRLRRRRPCAFLTPNKGLDFENWRAREDSNLRPTGPQPVALSTELRARGKGI